ncbi:MAG TPA: hypothetical protein VD996_10805, partial [Chitinophagaceae bacterium]|nr:hypothetical protein [Chitinophagaceae bacterium]
MILKKIFSSGLLLAAIVFVSCSKSSSSKPVSSLSNEVVLYWNQVAYDAFGGAAYQHSLMASRINAMVHLAMHDALNGIEQKYARYAFNGTNPKADPIAAAASAAH